MENAFSRKYRKVLEILPSVAECAQGRLVLVGGTALALFHLQHRTSIDLDFVPVSGDDVKLKEGLKGCLSKKGFRTMPGAFSNQFIIQFEETSIKVEVFEPDVKIGKPEERVFAGVKIQVASLGDLLRMKTAAYSERQEARDLFDIFCIERRMGAPRSSIPALAKKHGAPKNLPDIAAMAGNIGDAEEFLKVVSDAPS